MNENLPDSYIKKFCDKHLNVRDCGFAHPFVTHDGKCGFCELSELRKKFKNLSALVVMLSEAINKSIRRNGSCPFCFKKGEWTNGPSDASRWVILHNRPCELEEALSHESLKKFMENK